MALAKLIPAAIAATALLAAGTLSAAAKCTKLGFSVNDYGKEGPTRDAKALLDKHIAEWAAQNGIKKYTTGKKDVTCELFLDFGFFDEHTCKATATVCWSDGAQTAGAPAAPAAESAPRVNAKKVSAPTGAVAGQGEVGKAAAPAKVDAAAAKPAAPAAADATKKAPAKAPPPVKAKDPS